MWNTPLDRLRTIGFVEGCSFVVLLTIAMPLKHGFGQDWAVKIIGALHGGLWVLMLLAIAEVWWKRRWSWKRAAVAVFASVVPGGPFVLDRSLKQEQLREASVGNPA